MFNVSVNDKKNIYRSKPVMNVDTTGSSGDISIPKPLTYDYMPEGYPSKSVETGTLMEEQEVTFSDMGSGVYGATAPVILDVKLGDKLTVVWDGVSYDVEVRRIAPGPDVVFLIFGNLGLAGLEGATDQPFLYTDQVYGDNTWYTADTATTHTIKVIGEKETYKMIDENFLPKYVSYEAQDLTDEEKAIARKHKEIQNHRRRLWHSFRYRSNLNY